MEEYWVIASWIKGHKYYYFPRPDMDAKASGITHFQRDWLESSPYMCERFKNEPLAISRINEGRKKEHWGGVFQVERIFVSR